MKLKPWCLTGAAVVAVAFVAAKAYAKCADYKPSNDNTLGACGCSIDDSKRKGSSCTVKTFAAGVNGTCDCGSVGCQDGNTEVEVLWNEQTGQCGYVGCNPQSSGTSKSGKVKLKVEGCPS